MVKSKSAKNVHPCPTFVGLQVKYWRNKSGLTQSELSLRSTVKLRHLQEIEGGRVDIKIRTLGAIAMGLGIFPHKLLEPNINNSQALCTQCRHMLPKAR